MEVRRAQLKAPANWRKMIWMFRKNRFPMKNCCATRRAPLRTGFLYQTKLRVSGSNIWVITPAKAALYSWDSGKVEKELPVSGLLSTGDFRARGISIIGFAIFERWRNLSRLDLASGEIKTEQFGDLLEPALAKGKAAPKAVVASPSATGARSKQIKAGLMRNVSSNAIAQAVAVRPASARMTAMDTDEDGFAHGGADTSIDPDLSVAGTSLVCAGENVARVEVKVIEKKFVQYQAIKKPKVSELDKGVNAANAVAAMSEVLNEIQAERRAE